MELNREELKIMLDLLEDRKNTIIENPATMDDELFKKLIVEKDKITALYYQVFEELQPKYEKEENSIFGE